MNKKLPPAAALSAPLIVLLAIATATPAAAAPMPPPAMVLQQMHMVNQFEIKAAELAKQKANATLVKRYADRLWRDHHVADGKVKGLAKQLGFKLKSPAQMKRMMGSSGTAAGGQAPKPPMHQMQKKMQMMQQVMKNLKSASGSRFDQAYIKAMVKTHQKAIHMLKKVQTKKLDQPQVMGLINKLLPILKQHLKLAQHLQSRAAT